MSNSASTLELPALVGSNPLGALASFGLLKSLTPEHPEVRLSFTMQDDWIACLHDTPFSTTDDLVAWLSDWIKRDVHDQSIDWAPDVRMSEANFRSALETSLRTNDKPRSEMLSTLIADGAVDRSKGLVKPSLFYMVSGQQSFLGALAEVLADVRKHAQPRFDEALQGPWSMQAKAHGLGLDPSGERMYALRSKAPASEQAKSVSAATWLAFQAMPLFPSLSDQGRLLTTGFHRNSSKDHFRWPICDVPMSLANWKTLLQTQAWLVRGETALRHGIAEVYQSTRHTFGQGYGVFRPAKPISSELVKAVVRQLMERPPV
jgi:hypothetical protein